MTKQGKGMWEHSEGCKKPTSPCVPCLPPFLSSILPKEQKQRLQSAHQGVYVCAGCPAVSSLQGGRGDRRQAIICPLSPRCFHMLREARATHPRQLGKEAEGNQILNEWVSSECRSYKAKWSPRGVPEAGQNLEAREGRRAPPGAGPAGAGSKAWRWRPTAHSQPWIGAEGRGGAARVSEPATPSPPLGL